jgi:hypothetical protein
MSYSLTAFMIAIVFSTLVPYLPFVGFLLFYFKYAVDKYNLCFVYNSDFRGVGIIKKRVVPYSVINIVIYQVINIGFFSAKMPNQSQQLLIAGLTLVFVQILTIVVITVVL